MTSFLMLRLAIGTKSHYSVASVDQAPHHLVAAEMFGNPLALPIPDRLGVPFHGSRRQRVSGLPDLMFELPMAGLADEILTPGDEQVRAMVVFGGNPVLSAPGGRRLDAAFEQLDFCVALDFYITETSRRADVILPPVSSLQRNDFDAFVPMMSARNHTRYSPAAVSKDPGGREDWEILNASTSRIGRGAVGGLGAAVAGGANRLRINPQDLTMSMAIVLGPYGILRRGLRKGLTMGRIRARPHGIDLGPLVPGQMK
jgi:anaerobic selenocysteine-containing dehydrogenase